MSASVKDDAWHARRARSIGSSEIAALFDVQPAFALSRFGLWQVKSGRAPAPDVDNDRTRWGNRLEAVIGEAVAEEHKCTVVPGGFYTDPMIVGMSSTLDFEIPAFTTPFIEGATGPGVLETKNVDWIQHKRQWIDGEPPLHILLQLQHQLACSGYGWGVVAGLVGGNRLLTYPYLARPKLIASIRSKVSEFWRSIAENREPKPDGSDTTSAIIRAMATPTIDETLDMSDDNELPDLCSRLLFATEARKEAVSAEDEIKNQIAHKVGPHLRVMAQGFQINTSVTAAKPNRAAVAGEIIKGRAESRRMTVKEIEA